MVHNYSYVVRSAKTGYYPFGHADAKIICSVLELRATPMTHAAICSLPLFLEVGFDHAAIADSAYEFLQEHGHLYGIVVSRAPSKCSLWNKNITFMTRQLKKDPKIFFIRGLLWKKAAGGAAAAAADSVHADDISVDDVLREVASAAPINRKRRAEEPLESPAPRKRQRTLAADDGVWHSDEEADRCRGGLATGASSSSAPSSSAASASGATTPWFDDIPLDFPRDTAAFDSFFSAMALGSALDADADDASLGSVFHPLRCLGPVNTEEFDNHGSVVAGGSF